MSAPGDVGRRHADDERRACGIGFFVKVTVTLPLLVQTRFDRLRVVVLWEFHGWPAFRTATHAAFIALLRS